MSIIAILYHPMIPRSHPLALDIQAWLVERGINTWLGSTWDSTVQEKFSQNISLLIVLGGDGSICGRPDTRPHHKSRSSVSI